MTLLSVILMVVAILVGIAIAGVVLTLVVVNVLGGGGGLRALRGRYPVSGPPSGEVLRKQTLQANSVRWRRSTTVAIGPEGFYICPSGVAASVTNMGACLIPWSDLHVLGPGHIYVGMAATRLQVGNPQAAVMVVPNDLLARMQPYLSATSSA